MSCKQLLGLSEPELEPGDAATIDSSTVDDGAVDSSIPDHAPAPIVDGSAPEETLYYGACLSEFANNLVEKVFNFYVTATYTPATDEAKLTLRLQPLAVASPPGPPPTVSKAGTVGQEISSSVISVEKTGTYIGRLGTLTIPGAANPISGSDLVIEGTTLEGRFDKVRFCGRLGGAVTKPDAAARTLDPASNVCRFVPIEDGDVTPTFEYGDFTPAACPTN